MFKITISLFALLFVIPLTAQTKKIKRPKNRVGISSVDRFVKESFDLYDKVYMYDGYAAAGKSLEDEDIDVLEDALEDVTALSNSAPDIISDLDGTGALKQAKAMLQINRAKKALKYSIKTAKDLLAGNRQESPEDDSEVSEETSSENTAISESPTAEENSGGSSNNGSTEATSAFKVNSKFDFVPGDEILFFDDYSTDFIGDFPSKWNTNGSGEVVTINDSEQRWLGMLAGYGLHYIPIIESLPEEYTIEFDVLTNGLTKKTSSQAKLKVELVDDQGFETGDYYARVWIPFGQYAAFGIKTENQIKGTGRTINSTVTADIRKAVLNKPHISIAVNKERFRLWVNDKKYVDIPKLVPTGKLTALRFHLSNFEDNVEELFISNVKIAKGGLDLRRTLMNTGKVSTTGILFDSGSATIQPQSYGILRQISQVLQQDKNMKLQIIGHTDSDGEPTSNLQLSKSRAAAVKNALVATYKVSGERLVTDGKGQSSPLAENNTPNGKAQNRRVEFIKI